MIRTADAPRPLGAARFAPVSLDVLQDRAPLLTRTDRKYVVPIDELEALVRALPADTRVLDIGGRSAFRYDSIYFDTPELRSFHSGALGRRRRFKIRSRRYLDSGDTFLEVKTKGLRGCTVKERLPVAPSAFGTLDGDGLDFIDRALRELRLPPARELELRPTLRSRYLRTTLLTDDGTGRATIDTALEWSLPDGRSLRPITTSIVESKTAGPAGSIDRALWRLHRRPCAISKYTTGLAALDDHLPGNRWHRLLTGPLAARPPR